MTGRDTAPPAPAGQGATIKLDDGMYAVLSYEKRAGETCNDVIRRLLGMPPKTAAADEPGTRPLPAPARAGATPGDPPARFPGEEPDRP
jgi:hypothetical protein